ncbi:MAG: hypothetical protein WCR46_02320, partial [Deltaproteobacteria bacterium]
MSIFQTAGFRREPLQCGTPYLSGFDLGFGSRGAGNEDSHARTKIYVLAIIELVKMAFAALQLRIKCEVQVSCPYNIVMCLSKSILN